MEKHIIVIGIVALLLSIGLSGCIELFQNNNEINDKEAKPEVFPEGVINSNHILRQGVKRARFAINNLDSDRVHWDKSENTIDPIHDDFITSLADNSVKITYVLSYWDKEYVANGGEIVYPRFKTEEEIQRYLGYVQFIVHHFKDRVEYYEIWNEPNIADTVQWIELEDYINLVERTVPVIRQESPEAKIVVGGVSYIREQYPYEYLLGVLKSDDIMPLVDVISWHGMYGTSPEYNFHREYYYNYSSIVREIKETASSHGFTGEFVCDEMSWLTPECPAYPETYYSEIKCAKYYARGILMNLGMDVIVSQFYAVPEEHPLKIVNTIRNLCTVMAGTEPTNIKIELQSETTNIRNYSFDLPNGDKMIVLWNDEVAVDNDPGVEANLTIRGFTAQDVTGIDVLEGFQQPMIISNENGNLAIQNLIVRDYPLILRIANVSWEKKESETGIEWFQIGNTQSITQLQPKQSKELADNRIGDMASLRADVHTEGDVDWFVDTVTELGIKWKRLSLDYFDWSEVEDTGDFSIYYIDPLHDKVITDLADNGVKIIYCLVFWDEDIPEDELGEEYTRFKSEDEVLHYLDYARFIVSHFKDRVEYYEILNEPNHYNAGQQSVELADYINLVGRVVPVIRQEYPEAKIVVSGGYYLRWPENQDFLFGILRSDVASLVDAVAWHPMYGTSPEYDEEYYYDYPSLVQEIKDVASKNGFNGEYIVEELSWRTPLTPHPDEPSTYSETTVAKYYARGIITNLGMNLTTGLALEASEELPLMVNIIRNLSTVMAGAKPVSLQIKIQGEANNIRDYSFSLSNGNKLIALWVDDAAVDGDPGVKANLTVQGITSEDVTGIDVLNGYQQSITTSKENGNLAIQNIIIRDYPMILHIVKPV